MGGAGAGRFRQSNPRSLLIVGVHMFLVLLAYLLAWGARFDFPLRPELQGRLIGTIPVLLIVSFAVFFQFKPLQGVWRYVSIRDVSTIVKAKSVASILFLVASWALFGYGIPRTVFVLDWLFFAMIIVLLLVAATHILNGGVVFASAIPSVNPGARGHVAVLLAIGGTLRVESAAGAGTTLKGRIPTGATD